MLDECNWLIKLKKMFAFHKSYTVQYIIYTPIVYLTKNVAWLVMPG
jgi:hypothetical protein